MKIKWGVCKKQFIVEIGQHLINNSDCCDKYEVGNVIIDKQSGIDFHLIKLEAICVQVWNFCFEYKIKLYTWPFCFFKF